jgi:hypothetical protein
MTTRFLASILFLALLFGACRSGQKMIESGDYDAAIDFCVHKLRGKKKKKTEYVQGLELAFQKAQTRDLALAERLSAEDRPENWERVHRIHRGIRERQGLVRPLLPLRSEDGYRAQFELIDIAALERESREKAAEYLYNKAEDLIARGERGDKLAAREAYNTLLDLERRYFRDYKEKTRLMNVARDLGTSYVLFEVKNQSNQLLPRAFGERLLAIGKHDLDSEWKSFHFESKPGEQYDYKAVFRVRNIDVSPERVRERLYTDEKEVEDGWEYVLDARGNVLKDTLGNDLKRKRYTRIRADVVEVYQTKAVRLAGFVEVYDAARNNLLDTRDLGTEILFENYASTFTGDRRALSEESCRRIGNRPAPFPMTEEMLTQAAERLKPGLRDELRRNRAIL